jgi:hypothetical protein
LPAFTQLFDLIRIKPEVDVVYTGDVADLQKLCAFLPGVRVLSI